MVNLTLRTMFGFSIRASVQTRVAVGQLVIFRSVRNDFAHASKIATCAHFIDTCTLARFGSGSWGRKGVLTRTIGSPCLLEIGPAVALAMGQARRMHRGRNK